MYSHQPVYGGMVIMHSLKTQNPRFFKNPGFDGPLNRGQSHGTAFIPFLDHHPDVQRRQMDLWDRSLPLNRLELIGLGLAVFSGDRVQNLLGTLPPQCLG